jgi:threonine dehydrogenase-like Zn-dependent dehydrogenase
MGHIRIIGGLMPGGRKNMEYLARMLVHGRLDVNPLLTHRYSKFEDIEESLLLMKNKSGDLIKPVVSLA